MTKFKLQSQKFVCTAPQTRYIGGARKPASARKLVTQAYSSVNDINDIQVLCHVDDLMHGFVTSWENVLFKHWNVC